MLLEKEELARKRREARQLVAAKAEINKKEIRLREYSIRLEAETKGISFRFMKINKFIHELRRDNIRELFEKYLPIKASVSLTVSLIIFYFSPRQATWTQ